MQYCPISKNFSSVAFSLDSEWWGGKIENLSVCVQVGLGSKNQDYARKSRIYYYNDMDFIEATYHNGSRSALKKELHFHHSSSDLAKPEVWERYH